MAGVKLVVLYPQPKDIEEFERVYNEEHLPLAAEKLSDVAKVAITKVLGAPEGEPPYYKMAEVYFPSMEAMQASLGSEGGQETAVHAVSLSTGGPPIFLICAEEEVVS
jgi:uncharacterized protein (TIGR02118 family)